MLDTHRCRSCKSPWLSTAEAFERYPGCPFCGHTVTLPPDRVPAEPFRRWLAGRHVTWGELARVVERDPQGLMLARSFPEWLVEAAGIAFDGDPRLTEQLYPHLSEVV